MSLSNKKNKLLDESEIKEKIHFIENNFLNFDSTYEVITQDELNAKVRRYGELELSENTEKKDIDEYIYWNYVALEQSNVKQKDDIFAKLENALDVLSTRDLKKYFKSSSVLKYARSKKYYDRSLEVIRQFADDFSKINEDNFVSSCVPVYIPSAITFFVDQLFIDGTPNWQDLSSISRLFLMPIKYFEEQLQIQIDDYDDEENILYLESLRTIFESSFNVYHPSLIYAEASSVIKGVPGNVAYRIGNAYMRGKDLPLDKSKARQWFSYGMVVGDPFCTMAFIVYFLDLSIDSEMESESELTDLYTLLINCFALVRYIKTTKEQHFLSFEPVCGKGKDLEEQCLFNILALLNSLKFDCDYESVPFSMPMEIFDDFLDILIENLQESPKSYRLKAAVALFLEITGTLEDDPDLLNEIALALDLNLNKETEISDFLFDFIKEGLKEKDSYSLSAYVCLFCLYKGSFDKIPKKYLHVLSKQGYAKASFLLGNLVLEEHGPDDSALSYWEQAAEQGSSFALLNIALGAVINNDMDKAEAYATRAINYGNILGYYVLYKVYESSNSKLAHTYLRYAAEYIFPDAIEEYKHLKATGAYCPLPFMQLIEEMEELAEDNPQACLILCDMYHSGIFLPANVEKAFEYQQKAILNGYTSFFGYYQSMYKNAFPLDTPQSSYFPTFRKSLDISFNFMMDDKDDSAHDNSPAIYKMKDIINKLVVGKTQLEKDITYNLYHSEFWANTPSLKKKQLKGMDVKPDYQVLSNLRKNLVKGAYSVCFNNISEKQLEDSKKVLSLCDRLNEVKIKSSSDFDLVSAFMFIRSYSMPPSYNVFKEKIMKGKFSGSIISCLFTAMDFSLLSCEDCNISVKDRSTDNEPLDSDVFVSNIVQ